MRQLSVHELAGFAGGAGKAECAGLGAAAGMALFLGGPVGWLGAAFAVWEASEIGCFS